MSKIYGDGFNNEKKKLLSSFVKFQQGSRKLLMYEGNEANGGIMKDHYVSLLRHATSARKQNT